MKLLCGPMSPEVVEAAYSFSHQYRLPMGFVASVGQVPPDGSVGYTGFNLGNFTGLMNELAKTYPSSDVQWCRDHLGRVEDDSEIHAAIDYDGAYNPACTHLHSGNFRRLESIVKRWPSSMFEVGPGEDDSWDDQELYDLGAWAAYQPNVRWLSFPTGCVIDGLMNTQLINEERVKRMVRFGIPTRGHNCDYARLDTIIALQKLGIDAIQTAPQLGVTQTMAYLQYGLCTGLDLSGWIAAILNGRSWEKWSTLDHEKLLVAGHYHYGELSDEFKARAKSTCIDAIWRTLKHFATGFC